MGGDTRPGAGQRQRSLAHETGRLPRRGSVHALENAETTMRGVSPGFQIQALSEHHAKMQAFAVGQKRKWHAFVGLDEDVLLGLVVFHLPVIDREGPRLKRDTPETSNTKPFEAYSEG